MVRVLSVAARKGGVGKTTTSATLGYSLALQGKQVLLVDLDAQANLTSLVGAKRDSSLYDWIVAYLETGFAAPIDHWAERRAENVWLLPGHEIMANLEPIMARREPATRVHNVLRELAGVTGDDFDYIILDCPPALGNMTAAALMASTDVIIPVTLDPLAVDGLALTLQTVAQVRQRANTRLRVAGACCTMVDPRNVVQREMLERVTEICQRYKIPMLPLVPKRAAVQQAAGMGVPVTAYKRAADVADAYANIARTLIQQEAR